MRKLIPKFFLLLILSLPWISPARELQTLFSTQECKERLFQLAVKVYPNGKIDLKIGNANLFAGRLLNRASRPLSLVTGVTRLSEINSRFKRAYTDEKTSIQTLLDVLQVSVDVNEVKTSKIPESGPLVIVANHPKSGIEALAIASVILRKRTDVKILTNFAFAQIPELKNTVIAVDPYGQRSNKEAVDQAKDWVQRGGVLIVLPAGDVTDTEGPWKTGAIRVALSAQATIIPVFVPGEPSWVRKTALRIHPWVATAFTPREIINQTRSTLRLEWGDPIDPEKISAIGDIEEATQYVRSRTLAQGTVAEDKIPRTKVKKAPIALSGSSKLLVEEVAQLRLKNNFLVKENKFEVFFATAKEIPNLLFEIGRQREIAFRSVGEGSGRSVDLDDFDKDYIHLFTWDSENNRLVGAYRLGEVSKLIAKKGISSLYTSGFFEYSPGFEIRFANALELGRSFVTVEYQRTPFALFGLWKGIYSYLLRNPRYKDLIGAVSISHEYAESSKLLMIKSLAQNSMSPDSQLVKPKAPPSFSTLLTEADIQRIIANHPTMKDLSKVISSIEPDDKGVPVLMTQYLKMGASSLAFDSDLEFGTVDALIHVDVTKIPFKVATRFLPKEDAKKLYDIWGINTDGP